MIRSLDGAGGMFTPEQLEAAVRPRGNRYMPRSRLVSVEQTTNLGGGRVWPLETCAGVLAVARRHGLRAHMDGARLMNAVVASGVPAADVCGRVRHGVDRLHQGPGRAGGRGAGRLARADRRGVAVEADARRRVPPVGDRRRGLPVRARPPRRSAGRGSRARAAARRRAWRRCRACGSIRTPVETNIVIFEVDDAPALVRADRRSGRAAGVRRAPRARGDAPRRLAGGHRPRARGVRRGAAVTP